MAKKGAAAAAQAFVKQINAHRAEGLAALMTDDHRFVDALGASWQGREVMREGWKGYFGWFPDYKIRVTELIEDGDTVAMFGTAEGTYAADGKLAKKNHWKIPAAWKAVVRGGRIAEWRVYCDNDPARRIMAAHKPQD